MGYIWGYNPTHLLTWYLLTSPDRPTVDGWNPASPGMYETL